MGIITVVEVKNRSYWDLSQGLLIIITTTIFEIGDFLRLFLQY